MERLTIDNRLKSEVQQSLAAYLPAGVLWQSAHIEGTNLHALLCGLTGGLLNIEAFARIYNRYFIPNSGETYFLEDWEHAVGIPDDCFQGAALGNTDEIRKERSLHVLIKLAASGVQTHEDFERLALLVGYQQVNVLSGIDVGIPEPEGQFIIVVQFVNNNAPQFPLQFPIPFGTNFDALMQCLFAKLIPANCNVFWGEYNLCTQCNCNNCEC